MLLGRMAKMHFKVQWHLEDHGSIPGQDEDKKNKNSVQATGWGVGEGGR